MGEGRFARSSERRLAEVESYMDEFSGIRAPTRRKRDGGREGLPRAILAVALLLLLGVAPRLVGSAAASEHAAPAAPAAAPAAPAEPPPPPRPPPSAAERPPPPKLDAIAAPAPNPRLHWLVDATTGRALGGFDPVAYFLNGRPTLGDPALQLDWGGVTWLFQDQGTLDAFRDAPTVYAPLFGGYCAFAISQGRPAEGSPLHFVVHRNRLLFFADAASRTAFLLEPDRLLAEAEKRWPKILAELP